MSELLGKADMDAQGALFVAEKGLPTSLADRFLMSPFTVLDSKQGPWRTRKAAWLSLGIRSEEGRAEGLAYEPHLRDPDLYRKKQEYLDANGIEKMGIEEFLANHYTAPEFRSGVSQTGTSVFDPVLAELAYAWWCPPGGQIIDPFAGGSVRGVVAAVSGCEYTGIDLRGDQVLANYAQAKEILGAGGSAGGGPFPQPHWIVGDAMEHAHELPEADLLFTCPPYGDLEQYSDDPADLSNMPWEKFLEAYGEIIRRSAERLRPDRFAAIVVGEMREKGGHGCYRGFVPATVEAFEKAGLRFYNEAILCTPVGSGAMRAQRQFYSGRKLVKTHQNLLTFTKGDPFVAAKRCGGSEDDLAKVVA